MKKIVLFIGSFLMFCQIVSAQTTRNWTGAGGDNNWNNAANWDTGVPASTDEAVFNVAGTTTISSATGTPTISRLFISGGASRELVLNINLNVTGKSIANRAVQINAGSVTVGAGFTLNIEGQVNQEGLYMNNANAQLINNGTVNVTLAGLGQDAVDFNAGGVLTNNGTLNINGGAFDQRLVRVNSGTLMNNGTATITGGRQFSRVQIFDAGSIMNAKGGTLDITDGRIKVNGTVGTFTNNGLFTATVATPLRTDAGVTTTVVNNGFYNYNGAMAVFSDDGTATTGQDNGIDLNDAARNTIDFGGGTTADVAQVDYQFMAGANSVGTADATGSLTLGNETMPSDPGVISPAGLPAVSITVQNFAASVLPVELAYFRAEKMTNSVMLKWQTITEINNSHMTVERSQNGKDFVEIGTIEGAGNSTELLNYELEDRHPVNGANYYRLRQVDFNGTATLSDVQQVNFDKNNNGQITIFPTATQNEVTIRLPEMEEEMTEIILINAAGQVIETYTIFAGYDLKIEINTLANGLYFVRTSNTNAYLTGTFMKF